MTMGASIDYPKFESNFCNQTISHAVIAMLLYSTFVLDSAIVGFFCCSNYQQHFQKKTKNHWLISYLKHWLLVSQKFHTTKYVLCTLVCASLHPNVAFVVFA